MFTTGTQSVAWWGTVCLITIIGVAFGALFFSYFYLRIYSPVWPQGGIPLPDLTLALTAVAVLVLSALTMAAAARNFEADDPGRMKLTLAATFVLGITFLGLQLAEFLNVGFAPQDNAYASVFFVISWLLTLCVITGAALNFALQFRIWTEYEDREGLLPLQTQITALFWYFVVTAGLLVFAVLYLAPYVI